MSQPDQSFDNHAKLVPVFHGTLAFMIMVPMLYFVYLAVTDFSVERLVFALFMVGALSMGWHARLFPLRVQDRLIRLEEQLRLHRVLPEDQQGRIGDISTDLLIGLRFAPDDEVVDLAGRILEGELADRKAVKQAVKNWRADNQRI
ncbi:MAG: DUF6526 family protein [Gemmatimonadota bacterium]|jgi:uncharacterized membrane protein YciS (DUF1049 family)|nr:DUF6526 family protein [Gemmatimonadota bacterium]